MGNPISYHLVWQFATVEVVLLTLHRFVKQFCNKTGGLIPDIVVIAMCLTCFIGAIPYITQVNNKLKLER